MFNYQQFLAAVRWALTTGGTALTAHGLVNGTVWTSVTGLVVTVLPFIWAMIRHTKVGTLLAADDLPEVAGVIVKPTPEGEALARETPKLTVTPAGTSMAASIARTTL